MAKRYGHIGQQAKQDALAVLDHIGETKEKPAEGEAQPEAKGTTSQATEVPATVN